MTFSWFNIEGYYDPTAFIAMTHVDQEQRMRYRPVVFICSPLSGNVEENQENARLYCRFAVEEGCVPVAPHLFFPQFLDDDDPGERELGLQMSRIMLTKCREMWVFGDTITEGMAKEIRKAKARSMVIRYFTEDCEELPTSGIQLLNKKSVIRNKYR